MPRFHVPLSLLLLAIPSSALAQHSLGLDATTISAGGSTQAAAGTTATSKASNSRSGSGFSHTLNTSQTQTTTSKQTIQISVRNFGPAPDAVRVEWYFLATPVTLEPGKSALEQEYAFDQGRKEVSLAGSGTQTFPVESVEITSSVKRANRTRMSRSGKISARGHAKAAEAAGDKLAGWVVRIVADGRTVSTKASSQSLEDIARDEAKLKELIAR